MACCTRGSPSTLTPHTFVHSSHRGDGLYCEYHLRPALTRSDTAAARTRSRRAAFGRLPSISTFQIKLREGGAKDLPHGHTIRSSSRAEYGPRRSPRAAHTRRESRRPQSTPRRRRPGRAARRLQRLQLLRARGSCASAPRFQSQGVTEKASAAPADPARRRLDSFRYSALGTLAPSQLNQQDPAARRRLTSCLQLPHAGAQSVAN